MPDSNARHLYMLDESSLASTHQMQSFLEKIGPQDRVLLIGDTRQHQGVDAGKPFEQMQEWKRQTGDIQSYQHNERGGWLHIDPQGQFYDRQAQPIVREQALEYAGHTSALVVNDNTNAQSVANYSNGNDQGLSY